MIVDRNVRTLLHSKITSSKYIQSKPKRVSSSSEKQNIPLPPDPFKTEKTKSLSKNPTYSASQGRRPQFGNTREIEDVKKKGEMGNSLVCKAIECRYKHQFNQTLGNRKREDNKMVITADVTNIIRNLRNQFKVSTKKNTEQECVMTEEDIDQLFQGGPKQGKGKNKHVFEKNMQKMFSTQFTESKPLKQQRVQSLVVKDFADSIKYLELQESEDKLLAALQEQNLVKIPSDENIDKTMKFKEQFVVGKQIGEGAYASVRVGLDTSNNKKIAIKIYEKRKIKQPQRKKSVRREIKILQQLCHKNIVRIFDVIETNNHINLITEHISGPSLAKYLKDRSELKLSEEEAKKIFRQLVEAVIHLHQKSICHRDIKLDNILLDAQLSPKLIDFGFSTCISNDKKVKMFCGTPSFMAPEIVTKQEYKGPPADIWALGVVLYIMLMGLYPFKGQSDSELYARICAADPSISNISQSASNLLARIFTSDPDKRISGVEILQHQWLNPDKPCNKKQSLMMLQERYGINLNLSRGNSKRTQKSRQTKMFVQTEASSTVLKEILKNARESTKVSPRRSNEKHTLFRPSPMVESLRIQSKMAINQKIVASKLSNKAYF